MTADAPSPTDVEVLAMASEECVGDGVGLGDEEGVGLGAERSLRSELPETVYRKSILLSLSMSAPQIMRPSVPEQISSPPQRTFLGSKHSSSVVAMELGVAV
eukprot:CAMPEP_0115661794 /NCGR_PEP_ID=MMETSP0272-20121206/46978_1 /TAXON_ID=71861 /ORGANISM="Scrippsiella trochoidea, Strain CCMP3099" /LENGTH=101 /DNA_ID=CAMNT_0003100061 /DNA_START=66 /DNA_END=371 /DNA_ORIENTATION=+